jgi:transcriptional regulator with XRE-family HTH domain
MKMSKHRLLQLMRQSLGLKQGEVANRLGISPCYLSLIESGKKEPTTELMEALCEEYNIPSYLFAWNERDLERTATAEERSILERMNEYIDELLLLIMKRDATSKTQSTV